MNTKWRCRNGLKTIATTAGITAAGFTEFELVEAASIVVSGADELNTIFGTQDKESWYHIEVLLRMY